MKKAELNKELLLITYDKKLLPVEATKAVLDLQNVSFNDFKAVTKKNSSFQSENLNLSMKDFIRDNQRTLMGEPLFNLDAHFYESGFKAFFTRRYPIFSKFNFHKIIGLEAVANPIDTIFYPEIKSIIKSPSVRVHHQVALNFEKFFNEKKRTTISEKWGLSKREADCASLVMKGMTNKEMAKELKVSIRTIETFVNNIKTKMGIKKKREIYIELSDIMLNLK